MQLDVPTLMVAGAFVAVMSAALLLFAWYLYRETAAALWWEGADFVLACGIMLMAAGAGTPQIFFFGLTCLCASSALTWIGARTFDGRPVQAALVPIGPRVWIAAHWLPAAAFGPSASTLLNAVVTFAYYAAAAMGIKGGKGEALRARTALGLHGLTLMIAVPAMLTMTLLPDEPPPVLSWFGVIHFETIFFKAVNDNFGHAVGDRTLQIFAEECRRTLRPSHVVGRIGGEKFAAIYPGSGIEAGWAMAERVRRSFAESAAFVENYPVRCTTSAGVAAGDASDSLDDLLRQADEALYRAKSQGRNRIESYRVLRSENEYIIRVA